jgi:hypothetical protein
MDLFLSKHPPPMHAFAARTFFRRATLLLFLPKNRILRDRIFKQCLSIRKVNVRHLRRVFRVRL